MAVAGDFNRRRKVRTGQGTVVGNANPTQVEGKCHRKYTAYVITSVVAGKVEMVR